MATFFAIMSLVDASSRILITDPAYYLFNMINDGGFFISDNRYTAVINQVLVIFGVKMKLPLTVLIPLYSVSFVFVRFAYFFLVNNILKNRAAGFAIIVFTVTGVADSYFRPTSGSIIALLNSCSLYVLSSYVEYYERFEKSRALMNIGAPMLLGVFRYYIHPIAICNCLFFILFLIMHYVVVCVSFKLGDANMQMEKIFLPLVMFSALVFFSSLDVILGKNQLVVVIESVVLVGYGANRINKSRPRVFRSN